MLDGRDRYEAEIESWESDLNGDLIFSCVLRIDCGFVTIELWWLLDGYEDCEYMLDLAVDPVCLDGEKNSIP